MDLLMVAVPFAMGLVGLVCSDRWQRHRSSRGQRNSAEKMAVLQSALDAQFQTVGNLQAELRAQRERCFALEGELEAGESDWARNSLALVSFDAQTFQVDRSTHTRHSFSAENYLPARLRSPAGAWAEVDAANSDHGALCALPDQLRQQAEGAHAASHHGGAEPARWREHRGPAGTPPAAGGVDIRAGARRASRRGDCRTVLGPRRASRATR